jgi:hypothetical protein
MAVRAIGFRKYDGGQDKDHCDHFKTLSPGKSKRTAKLKKQAKGLLHDEKQVE